MPRLRSGGEPGGPSMSNPRLETKVRRACAAHTGDKLSRSVWCASECPSTDLNRCGVAVSCASPSSFPGIARPVIRLRCPHGIRSMGSASFNVRSLDWAVGPSDAANSEPGKRQGSQTDPSASTVWDGAATRPRALPGSCITVP